MSKGNPFGNPKGPNAKRISCTLKLGKDDLAMIDRAAFCCGMKRSAYIRKAALDRAAADLLFGETQK